MAAIWFRFRSELRGRWRALLALAVLVGIAGGVAVAAIAGARRTDTAFDRLLADTEAWDVLVNPDIGIGSALDEREIARLPGVLAVARVDGLVLGPARARSFEDAFDSAIILASDGVAAYEFGRPRMISGRMPRRDRPHEALVNPLFARRHNLEVGDRYDALGFTVADLTRLEDGEFVSFDALTAAVDRGAIGEQISLRITGIGLLPDEVVVDEGFENAQMLLPPAFRDRYPDVGVPYWGAVVRLRDGRSGLAALRREVEGLVPDEAIAFQSTAKTTTKVERAVRPSVGALMIFAVVIALTGMLVIGQALARQMSLDANDNDTLRAVGTTRAQLFSVTMLRAAAVAVIGGLLALGVAVIASPLTPIGVARDADPDPGFRLDAPVLALGFFAVVVVVLALAAIPAWRSARARPRDEALIRPSRVARAAADLGAPVPVAAGLRMALEPGRGRTAVPVRTTIISAGLAIATVVAAGVFAASLDHLVSTPRLYGWNWDTQMSVNFEGDDTSIARAAVVDLLDSSPAVAKWGTVSLSDVRLDSGSVPAVGIKPEQGAVVPTLVDGALPARDGEIALGALTKDQLGVSVGDTVRARDNDGDIVPLRLVGTVVLPGLGTYPGADKTSLGEGAVVTQDALYRLGPDFGRGDFVVQFTSSASGARRDEVIRRANEIVSAFDPEGFQASGLRRPSDIVSYDRVRTTPLVLALVLAVLASATVAHALVSAVRRRRRDLAMLVTLGLTRRQVSSTVAWQATTVAVLALVIGIPLGVITGRWAWSLLASDLGTLSEPRVPLAALVIGVPVVLLLFNAVAYVPGRIAARLRPAVVLRSE